MNDIEKVDYMKKLCDMLMEVNKKELQNAKIHNDFTSQAYHLGSLNALQAVYGELKK